MATSTTKQVRFAKLLEAGGEPHVHLPFADPERDKNFLRAAKEERVVTIKQDPTSKHKDFGIVDFVKEKFATYLIFPRSLREYSGQRAIGIKYDVLKAADVAVSSPVPRQKMGKPKKPKPKPQPKRFSVRVRVTSIEDKEIEVTAWSLAEAKAKAREEIESAPGFSDRNATIKVMSAQTMK